MGDRFAQMAIVVQNMEELLKLAGKPGKYISKEKMRFREKLSRLSDSELMFLAKMADRDIRLRAKK